MTSFKVCTAALSAFAVAASSSCASLGTTTGSGAGAAAPDTFDAALATRLGADEFGMRPYVLAFLKAGPNRNQDPRTADALQRAHLDNIRSFR
jgi:hypothetical protein